MRVNYRSMNGLDDLYIEETQNLAVFAAEGRVTHNEYKVVATGHGDVYNLIVDAYWNTEVFLCESIIAAKALIEKLEGYEERYHS
jgi:hypothetical protein